MGHTTSLPLEDNSISLDDTVKDDWGLPAMRVTYKDHPDDLKFAKWLQDRSMEILEAAGAQNSWRYPITESNFAVHLLGTCRMGNDREVFGDQRRPSHPRRAESFPVRRFELRHQRPRPADGNHPGTGVSRQRPHHRTGQEE